MSILSTLAGTAIGTTVSSVTGSLLGPGTDRISYLAYRGDPTRLPDPHVLIQAYNAGMIGERDARNLLRYHGVEFDANTDSALAKDNKLAWLAASRMMQAVPSVQLVIGGWAHGLLPGDQRDTLIKRAGGNPSLWQWARQMSLATPDIGSLCTALSRGVLDFDEWKAKIVRSGSRDYLWSDLLPAFESVPTVAELLSLRNRNIIQNEELDRLLHRNGITDPQHREYIARLRRVIPSISDLIAMQVKEAFDPALAEELGLYDESPKEILPALEAQGLLWESGVEGVSDGVRRQLLWPDMYWAAHWRPVSPEQAFRMWHLIRPETVKRYTDRGLNVRAVDLEFVRRLLRIQDYPNKLRDYLAAIAFQPLRLIDIRNALRFGIKDRDWAIERMKDRGLHPDDAETSVDIAIKQEERLKTAAVRSFERAATGRTLKNTVEQYKLGIVKNDAAKQTLVRAGMTQDSADVILGAVDAENKLETVRSTIKMVRRRMMDGILTENEAKEELKTAGIQEDKAGDYTTRWKTERDQSRRIVTTAKIQEWARLGFLTPQDAKSRLQKLGWSEADQLLHLAEVQYDVNQVRAKQAQATLQSQKTQAKELERLAKESQRQTDRIRAEIRRISPISTLKKWLREGIIDTEFFKRRATSMGYPAADILRYAEEALGEPVNGEQQEEEAGASAEEPQP